MLEWPSPSPTKALPKPQRTSGVVIGKDGKAYDFSLIILVVTFQRNEMLLGDPTDRDKLGGVVAKFR
jgi:hypothetical protein